ncbi:uncharacterized protein LOC126890234 [Diabrotica virgifera virgifera]|uniref:GIY-YIG domain-containing protein n=1 Tax=Diabrotica virgifera virgifera TaxID=50390 RepID=A0ABM5KXY3_DIAVI|nr:uncharacterized protein LOC126890234 [Diabrotica virgifera virgifera]
MEEQSSILASYVMDDLLDTVIPVLPFRKTFLKKYVDDIILALPKAMINELLYIFNDFDPHIQFTVETEDKHQSVPFLDTKLIRSNNNVIITDWYRKPISSGRYINYWSYHKYNTKINLIKQMKNRILQISDQSFHNKNLKLIRQLFLDNSYPNTLLTKLLFNTTNDTLPGTQTNPVHIPQKINPTIDTTNAILTPRKYFKLPFIQDLTPKLTRIFKSVDENIKIANYTVLTVGSIFTKIKDKTPTDQLSNIVYCIPCASCNKQYIGQTNRHLKGRIASHKSDSRLYPDRCSLAKHVHDEQHIINYNETKILAMENNLNKRLYLEMAFITQTDYLINKKSDVEHLSEIYAYLLNLEKQHKSTHILNK